MARKTIPLILTDAQLKSEIERCEFCEEKPCREACPARCSPADFIMAAKAGGRSDYRRAAALIYGMNPFGGVCGAVCPDKFCVEACVHRAFDSPVRIPEIQAKIIQKAFELGAVPVFEKGQKRKEKVAIIGGGPAGFSAAAVLVQLGYGVVVFESEKKPGGMCRLIPHFRMAENFLKNDIEFIKTLGDITIKYGVKIGDPASLLEKGFDAVLVCAGLERPLRLKIKGGESAVYWNRFLRDPGKFNVREKVVAVIGGGAVAADCAETAARAGAARVEMFALEKLSEMPLEPKELRGLMDAGVHITGRTRVISIQNKGKRITGIRTIRVTLPEKKPFHPKNIRDVEGSELTRRDIDFVVVAIGAAGRDFKQRRGVYFAGDLINGASTVVEAVASGKNAAMEIASFLGGGKYSKPRRPTESAVCLKGYNPLPIGLDTDFFGRKIASPFLLSAAPPTDGYDQMRKAYEAGWAGGVMKTAFDNVNIHIPSEYMFAFTKSTYGNCDNVSGHTLDRVCREIGRLVREFPDRLTMASTGGQVTGRDHEDRAVWQANTKKLEDAGAMGIEYSLSCPQGGDGTKGDIVSQDPELTAKIVDWVMEVSDPDVPKLFKLTAAVTAINSIITAIKRIFEKYPQKKAGVTLANTFPAMAFRKGRKESWEEGIIVGMSGEDVTPISNLTLAKVSGLGVAVSGNGGPMNYRDAANFLALGARTVQFCTVVMKYGYGIVNELHSGLSCMMEERGIKSVNDLIGRALPFPITPFDRLPSEKKIPCVIEELCRHCGNCARCSYLAISLNGNKIPEIDPSKCIGCSICAQKCFSGALYMRERTAEEMKALRES